MRGCEPFWSSDLPVRLLLLILVAAFAAACVPNDAQSAPPPRPSPNLEAARELDQQGVRAFQAGRYADAVRYFRASYKLGGPPSELWNIARARERLDDPESALLAIHEYLAQSGLSADERVQAEREARALQSRASTLTIATAPSGANVSIDGRAAAGATPLTVEVPAGPHTIVIKRAGYRPQTRQLEARFGRAVIVDLDLAREGDEDRAR